MVIISIAASVALLAAGVARSERVNDPTRSARFESVSARPISPSGSLRLGMIADYVSTDVERLAQARDASLQARFRLDQAWDRMRERTRAYVSSGATEANGIALARAQDQLAAAERGFARARDFWDAVWKTEQGRIKRLAELSSGVGAELAPLTLFSSTPRWYADQLISELNAAGLRPLITLGGAAGSDLSGWISALKRRYPAAVFVIDAREFGADHAGFVNELKLASRASGGDLVALLPDADQSSWIRSYMSSGARTEAVALEISARPDAPLLSSLSDLSSAKPALAGERIWVWGAGVELAADPQATYLTRLNRSLPTHGAAALILDRLEDTPDDLSGLRDLNGDPKQAYCELSEARGGSGCGDLSAA